MSNIISYNAMEQNVKISNGLTDVFIEVIGLSTSILANEDYEKMMAIWILEKDQNSVGVGTIGFDISEMLWQAEFFYEQKSFMLNSIRQAKNKLGWEHLGYNPNEDLISPILDDIYSMIEKFKTEDIHKEAVSNWLEELEKDYPALKKCNKHSIYETIFGCYICNRNS